MMGEGREVRKDGREGGREGRKRKRKKKGMKTAGLSYFISL